MTAKVARVEISLPDGTELKVTGPLAEEIARRLMNPAHHYCRCNPWPVTWTSGTTYPLTVTNGSITTT